MPDKVTPLFHAKTLDKAVQNHVYPSDLSERQAVILKWIEKFQRGTLAKAGEVSLHGDFLRDFFQDVLGYRSLVHSDETWELHAEQSIAGTWSADAALGFFEDVDTEKHLKGRVVAAVELKSVSDPLDRVHGGRSLSAVEQGWRYAIYAPCRWIIVSNYQEIRLYHASRPTSYERFLLPDLADLGTFKRFIYLLGRDTFLPREDDPRAKSVIDSLLERSGEAQEEVTRAFYQEYKQLRLDLVNWFHDHGPSDLDNRDLVLIEKAQKVLDRILFIAFCEDRTLLPAKTIQNAHDHRDPYDPKPIWRNYQRVFQWVDKGHESPLISGYNGGLFQPDPILDGDLVVPDGLCTALARLCRYDFADELSVDILGHVFEQSITDLEEMKALATGQAYDQKQGKRKTQGVFYTPAFVTTYIVSEALGGYLNRRRDELRARSGLDAIPERMTLKRKDAELAFWRSYRDDVLAKTRVLDPACGSGAFLIAAYDFLLREYVRVTDAIAAFHKGMQEFGDLNKTILNRNLYGVDLSPESVEITKLSLWLKTAQTGKQLTYLDDNVREGDSIVSDPAVSEHAFPWAERFAEAEADGGFDVVIGNPPYVRQELLAPIKPYLQGHYQSYDGVADLYTYFYERGFERLKPGGVLSFIVTNKWLRSGYGEALRRFFAEHAVFERIVDFGHAPVFEDADVFPCIVVARKPDGETRFLDGKAPMVKVASVPREELGTAEERRNFNLAQHVEQYSFEVPWSRYAASPWSLEHPAVESLMEKMRTVGIPLVEFAGFKPQYGIKTGLNEAFLIDTATKDRLVREDPKAADVVRRFLRGQDIKRWVPEWAGLWFILLKSSGDYRWPWHNKAEPEAEGIFARTFPSLYGHMKPFESALRKRQDRGRFWWELRPCAYYDGFERPKIVHTDIAWRAQFAFAPEPVYVVNTAYAWATDDLYLLSVVNSPLSWSFMWRNAIHGKDEALRLIYSFTETLPIARPSEAIRADAETGARRLIELTRANQETTGEVLNWLRVERGIESPGQRLVDLASLDAGGFVAEVKKRSPKTNPLRPSALRLVQETYAAYVPPMIARRAEIQALERGLSDLVNQAYGLTPEEIALMWRTAPPRMPIPGPVPSQGKV